MFPAWAIVKKKIALSNLQTISDPGFESGDDENSSFLWIKLKTGYSQEMPTNHLYPIFSWEEASNHSYLGHQRV